MSRAWGWGVAGILLAAIAWRAYGLAAKPLWLDEAMSVVRAEPEPWRPFWESVRRDNHPFLYYLLLHFALKLGTGDIAVRLLSLAGSVAAVVGTGLLAREAAGARAGVWAGALMAASAFQLFFAQEARPYAVATAFAAFACWMWVRMWCRGFTAGRLAIYGLFSVLSVYCFYYCGLLLAAQGIHAVIERKRWRELAGRLALTWALAGAAILPLLVHLRFLAHLTGLGTRPAGRMDGALLAQAARELLFGYLPLAEEDAHILLGLAIAACVLAVGVCVWAAIRSHEVSPALLPLAIVPLCALLAYRAPVKFETKHLAMCAPALWAIIASFGRERGRGDLLLGVVLLVNIATGAYYHSDNFVKEDWRGVAEVVAKGWRPGDKIVFCPFYLKNPFDRYFPQRPYDFDRVTYAGGEEGIDATYWVLDSRQQTLGLYVLDPAGGRRDIVPWELHTGRYWLIEGDSNTIPRSDLITVTFGARYEPTETDFVGMGGYLWVTLWEPRK